MKDATLNNLLGGIANYALRRNSTTPKAVGAIQLSNMSLAGPTDREVGEALVDTARGLQPTPKPGVTTLIEEALAAYQGDDKRAERKEYISNALTDQFKRIQTGKDLNEYEVAFTQAICEHERISLRMTYMGANGLNWGGRLRMAANALINDKDPATIQGLYEYALGRAGELVEQEDLKKALSTLAGAVSYVSENHRANINTSMQAIAEQIVSGENQ
jgi:hypothetical protein